MIRFDPILHKCDSVIKNFSAGITKHSFTRPLYSFAQNIGLVRLKRCWLSYLLSLEYHRNPTQKMKSEKQLFLEHAQELKSVYDLLEDDKSRSVFENILKYRTTYDWTYLKKSRTKDYLHTQYLVPELKFSDHEIIVDCGAYNGDTAKLFYENIPGCRVIALEPDEDVFEGLQSLKLEGLKAIQAGVWSEDTTLSFLDGGSISGGSRIDTSGTVQIAVKALDRLPECRSATYIKMDVEGAEMEALKGAATIIEERKPKLAICIYHHPQDFFEIPLYIKKLNPNYKLFVYHHNDDAYETVLYAV